jgi:hypothetical protein
VQREERLNYREVRGGAWGNDDASLLGRTRGRHHESIVEENGFRCAR